jgi:hypothetical protein
MAASIWKLLPSIDAEAGDQNYTFMDIDVGRIRSARKRFTGEK